ncbi:DUF2795 domain-containing protein [Methanoculleus sp. FWC-SCC3]|uniref:DUF2795 domain-containing protein n=1 Tax=Methanoculleus methanifontis TaxID=2584086 RepID=A0ABT8M246_9EURY|nr:DUF2795 domain-containing protein [Methanoculleus sp. FWC-SCC3]MDN7013114.1 DUF2795 domain-containing protein [Methanoculleus sp. FWC-SCC3]
MGARKEVIETALPTGMTASRIHEYLRDAPYPAIREDLVDYVREAGVSDDILRALERLPERRYANPDAVTETIGMLM